MLYYIVVGLFIGLLFFNLYFRIRIIKHYSYLVKHKIEFGAKHIFSAQLLESEVLPKYPQHNQHIITFIKLMKHSLLIAVSLVLATLVVGLCFTYF